MKSALRGLRFFLRTGHRDPQSWIDSFAKKEPNGQEALSLKDIQRAVDEVVKKSKGRGT